MAKKDFQISVCIYLPSDADRMPNFYINSPVCPILNLPMRGMKTFFSIPVNLGLLIK